MYVYDVFGRLAAEYSDDAPASPCQTCYLSYDHLGSIRLVTDQSANVIARHDYLPFGEEIPSGSAGRSNQYGATDYVSQRFTGQTRDSETGLDFFHARYFGAALGRFTSVDPNNAGARPGNPQSWNGYSYVLGNPFANVDASGGDPILPPPPLSDAGTGADPYDEELDGDGGESGGGDGPISVYTPPVTVYSGPPDPVNTVNSPFLSPYWSDLTFLTLGTCWGCSGTSGQPPKIGTFTRMPLPTNHLSCSSLGTSYVAPPTFSLKVIVRAGHAAGRNISALRRAVGQGGTFDFQRVTDSAGNIQFYSSYTPVSNFAVGAYEFGAGFTRGQGDFLANLYATLFSSNAGDPKQALYRHLGYDAATKGDAHCSPN